MQKDKEPITEAPITEDVEEDSEPLIIRRRKGKMVVLESKSTDTATYTEAARDQPEFIPMLSMLEKNVVAN